MRHQTHTDFRRRIMRIDPAHAYAAGHARARARDATQERPLTSALTGFGWAYVALAVGNNRQAIEDSLAQGSLPATYHDYVFMTLAALLATSFIALGLHLFRVLFQSGARRRNSAGMLAGVLGALMLVYTPTSVWSTGFGMLDQNSRALLTTASNTVSDTLPGIDLGNMAFVSSYGR